MDAKGENGQYVMIYKPDPFPLPAGSGSARSRTLVFLPPTAISVVSSSTNLAGPLDIGLPCGENFLHSVKARPPAARRPPAPGSGRSLRSRPRLRVRPVANTRWMTKVVQVPGDAVAVLEQLQTDDRALAGGSSFAAFGYITFLRFKGSNPANISILSVRRTRTSTGRRPTRLLRINDIGVHAAVRNGGCPQIVRTARRAASRS